MEGNTKVNYLPSFHRGHVGLVGEQHSLNYGP